MKIDRIQLCRTLLMMGIMVCAADSSHAQTQSDAFRDEVSYTNDIRPIVRNFCTTCHAGENPEGEFVLTSYDDVRKHIEKGELLKRINDADEPMPQDGLLPPHMRRLFQQWADGGYVNKGTRKASTAPGPRCCVARSRRSVGSPLRPGKCTDATAGCRSSRSARTRAESC